MWSGGRNFTLPTVRVGNDCRAILDEQEKETIRRRAKARMPLLEALTTAPSVPHGSYRILIDAHLTGGLVHEAFGHAAESDAVYRGSILSDKGCFRRGMRVGPEKISIVDGPLDYDWGDQPFSADGFPRRTVTIVERGVLKEALADAFTARPIGAEPAGAERVQGYAFVPIPRMSNIRLEIEDCLPWECDFEDLSAQQLYHFLLQNHVVEPAEEVLFLSGYRGGQVNSTSGDFVFNCSLMFRLKNGQATLCAPTIFSGNIFAVLDSIRLGIGRRHLNRSGMCGKQGQKVPTSGGGPLFTLIDPHPDIRIGGR